MEFPLKFLNHVIAPRLKVVTNSVHLTANRTDRYVRTVSMFTMFLSGSNVPLYESNPQEIGVSLGCTE